MHLVVALRIRNQSADRAGQVADVVLEVQALVPELDNQLPTPAGAHVLSDAFGHILTTCDANIHECSHWPFNSCFGQS